MTADSGADFRTSDDAECFDTLNAHPFPVPPGVTSFAVHFAVYADSHGHQRLAVFGGLPEGSRQRAVVLHLIEALRQHLDEMR